MLKEQNIRCSVIGLAANVHVCQRLCRDTQGTTVYSLLFTLVLPTSIDSCPSYDDCLEDKREDYQNCSVLYCVPQLYQLYAHSYEQFLQVNYGLLALLNLGIF